MYLLFHERKKKYQRVTAWAFIGLCTLGLVLNVFLLAETWVFWEQFGAPSPPVSWLLITFATADFATPALTAASVNELTSQLSYLINWVGIAVIILFATTVIVIATCGVVLMPKNRAEQYLTEGDLEKTQKSKIETKSKPIFDSNLKETIISILPSYHKSKHFEDNELWVLCWFLCHKCFHSSKFAELERDLRSSHR